MTHTHTSILALGSNLGDGRANLLRAIELIASRIGQVVAQSSVLTTEPWGFVSEHTFVNQVIIVKSALSAEVILAETQQIEKALGRITKSKQGNYADRIIDIDLIDYDGQIVETVDLQLPHPQMQKRLFVLTPLCEIWPTWEHPILHKSAQELSNNLTTYNENQH
ncbi:MAG: 2-amino-4-hydroxy-6-hydroxymethyldihydropteridine diphosphokinase [Prevotellaceae bacterium]|nr:2-amino-4-hydroxy-6-hydroxymethyldihydropteridine diphosphokinase [Prevotellaceae bacterium]